MIDSNPNANSDSVKSVLNRHLIFVHGKGGVGKTLVSKAIATALAEKDRKTLWVTIEDPTQPAGEVVQIAPSLWHLNCDFLAAFEEYITLKIGAAPLSRLFLRNQLIRYLAKAAPGVHELVLLGKIWYERLHYTHLVVDLPSTGYGLAMFQSTENFRNLFRDGPLHRDAEAMLETFEDRNATGHLILALPEETPLREALELDEYLEKIFPNNPAAFIVNRVFPALSDPSPDTLKDSLPEKSCIDEGSPLAKDESDYVQRRCRLEEHNLRIWREKQIAFGKLEFVPPPLTGISNPIVQDLALQFQNKGYL